MAQRVPLSPIQRIACRRGRGALSLDLHGADPPGLLLGQLGAGCCRGGVQTCAPSRWMLASGWPLDRRRLACGGVACRPRASRRLRLARSPACCFSAWRGQPAAMQDRLSGVRGCSRRHRRLRVASGICWVAWWPPALLDIIGIPLLLRSHCLKSVGTGCPSAVCHVHRRQYMHHSSGRIVEPHFCTNAAVAHAGCRQNSRYACGARR